MSKRYMVRFAAAAVVAGLGSFSYAAPYAAQITESTGTVSFVLSEDAGEVIVVRDGVPTSLGALTAGTQSFARSGAAVYEIIAKKSAANGYMFVDNTNVGVVSASGINSPLAVEQEIGDANTNVAQQFELPRDVAINTNPLTPSLFGRAYVLQPRAASTAVTAATPTPRAVTEGIYILNADRSNFFTTNTDTALTGGVAFDPTATVINDLFKADLDADGNLYVSDQSDPNTPGARVFNSEITTGGAFGVGVGGPSTGITPDATNNHGTLVGIAVYGSPTAGNLVMQAVGEDVLPLKGVILTYNLGSQNIGNSVLPTSGGVAPQINFFNDLERGLGGRLYMSQNRTDGGTATGAPQTGLWVLNPAGSAVTYSSGVDSVLLGIDGNTAAALTGIQDVFRGVQGIDVSPDGKWLATNSNIGGDGMVVPLIEGVPDIANRALLDFFTGGTGTDVEFDAANNLYVSNRSSERVKAFAPGSISQTTYSSAGTFKVVNGATFDGSGDYSDSSKWAFGIVPNFTEDAATVGAFSTGAQTLNIASQVVLAKLTFAGGNYTVGGSSPIVMGGDGTFESFLEGRIIAESGNQTINALVDVRKSFGVAAYTGSSLTLTNVTYANAAKTDPANPTGPLLPNVGNLTIQKFGGGLVSMPVFDQKLLVVRAGTLKFNTAASAGAAKVKQLWIAGTSAAPDATLDLGGTGLVVDYASTDTSPLATVQALIASGFNAGAYNGKGITSSLAASNTRYGVAAVERSSLSALTSFMGVTLDTESILIRTTLKGDANLSGTVDFDDLLALAQNYDAAGTGKTWILGDFDYNGTTNFDDLLSLAQNYSTSVALSDLAGVTSASFAADWALAQSLVPEPTSLTLMGLGALALRRRRA